MNRLIGKFRGTKIALVGLFLFGAAFTSKAQVVDNNIKLNLFGTIVGQYQLSYERSLSENSTLQLGLGYITRSGTITWSSGTSSADADFSTSGFIIIPEYRYYFSEAPKGFYAGAFARIRSTKYKYDYIDATDNEDWGYEQPRFVVGGGGILGFQALFGDAVALDLFLGPQFKSVSSSTTYNDPTLDRSGIEDEELKGGIGVRFGVNLGFAF